MAKALSFCVHLLLVLFTTYGLGQFYPTDSLMLKPGDVSHFVGIVTSSFLHDNVEHLIYNSLGLSLFYVFLIKGNELQKPIKTTIIFIMVSNLVVFLFGNPSYYYLGSSNLVYALAGFSIGAIILNGKYLLAIPLVFLGGTLYRGMMITDTQSVSFLSHYFGLIVGIVYYVVIHYKEIQEFKNLKST